MVDLSHINFNSPVMLNTQPAEVLFNRVIANAGLQPKEIIADGEIHRCKVQGDKNSSKNGYYVLFDHADIAVGVFGSWRGDWQEKWTSINKELLTTQQQQKVRQHIEEAKAKQRLITEQQNEETAKIAFNTIDNAHLANPEHPYLKMKQVKPHNIYQVGGLLYIPMVDATGSIYSYQTIADNGEKRFLAKGKKKGCFYPLGQLNDIIYIAEGYSTAATIHEATEDAVFVAFDCGNLLPVAEALRKQHPNKRIILCADNDQGTIGNPGITKATEAAKAVGGIVKYPNIDGDFNDLACQQGLQSVRNHLGVSHKKNIISLSDLLSSEYSTDYVIDKFLVERGVNQIFGESGHLKSFVSLDMMMHVASNKPWHDRAVKKGWCLYVVGEDMGGYRQRAAAWLQHHDMKAADVHIEFRTAPVMLPDLDATLQFRQELDELIEEKGEPPILITLDTKARCFAGNENVTSDANDWVSAVDGIIRDYKTTFLIVHHTGHMEKDRSRGAYAFLGALDSEYKVTKHSDNHVSIRNIKPPKNDEAPAEQHFNVQKISTIYKNSNGHLLTSLVLDKVDEGQIPVETAALKNRERFALEILNELYTSAQNELASRGDNPLSAKIEMRGWKESVCSDLRIFKPNTIRNTINVTWKRILQSLIDAEKVTIEGVFCTPRQ